MRGGIGISINKRTIGSDYEAIAEEYLVKNGYEILEKNFTSRFGEIDIIAKDNNILSFVEVKYRRSNRYGFPEEAIDYRKQQKIISTAKYYIYKKGIPEECPCRFDAISICGNNIRIIKNIFYING